MEWSKCNVSSSVRVRFSSACCPDSHNTTACIVFCNFTDSDRREEKPCDTGSTVPLSGSGGSGNGGGSVTSGVHHGGGGTGSSTVGLHGTGIGGHAPSASSSDGRGSGSGGTGSSANGSGGTGSSASGQNGDGTSGLTAGVTGRQEMLTPGYLIPPLVCPGARVCQTLRFVSDRSYEIDHCSLSSPL
ncbi:lysozyme D-like isoform X2 [Ostrea edulis]|uniref:lysozyme D-like isoform X2 n=1 Tax=Ostrea edulis TaxID=37623 RepID=UPI0024AF3680|nr:lysozyme D-like isoform X2 [Ostrea edulis]